jgi:predicted glycosyltransferase
VTARSSATGTGFDPADLADRQALRQELGYRDDEQVCIVTVGGSGVGGHLLRRVIEAFPEVKRRVPALRMVVVTGPRINPGTLPQHEGLELRAYVHQLSRHLAACDLAVVATSDPDAIADAIADELGRAVDYRPVETDGAARAARFIAQLV